MNSRTDASPQSECSRRKRCSRRRAPSSVRSSASRKPWEGERGIQKFYQDSKVHFPSRQRQLATGGYDQTAETGSAVSRSPKGNGRSPR